MMSNNYLKQLNSTYENYSKLFEQSDGSKLHRASDDAVGYSKYLRFQNNKTYNEQYQANVSTAVSWMKNADAAMVNITDLLQTFKAKVEAAGNSTNNESDMKDIAKELLASVQEQVAAMNTQIGDRFLFAGQKDTTMPFEISADKMERGDTFTLDEKQSAFFSGSQWGDENTTVKQMLQLNCETKDLNTGEVTTSTYYMNVQTGDIFSEDFVKNGYKNESSFDPATQRKACVNEYRYDGSKTNMDNAALKTFFDSKNLKSYTKTDPQTGTVSNYYVDEAGNIYDKNAASPNVDDVLTALRTPLNTLQISKGNMYNTQQATATGTTIALNDTQKAYFNSKQLTEYQANNGNTFYVDDNGNQYEQATIQAATNNGVIAITNQPLNTVGNLSDPTVNNFRVSDFFGSNGVINANGEQLVLKDSQGNQLSLNGANTTVKLSTTKQYIVTYSGDDKYISMVKKNGGVDQSTDTVNVTGQDIWGTDLFDVDSDPASGTAMLNQLLYSVAKIDAADYKWASSQGMTIADSTHATVLGAETKMAARRQAYDASTDMLTTQNESITSDITDVSSTDIAQLATQLMQYQTIYSLSLSVGAKILPGTLADYLS